jgi:L-cysteine desulfidase
MLTDKTRKDFIAILKEEMIPAMGCTEPISLAYAAAKARAVLGKDPEFIKVYASGNMIKNVRCVRIPNSGGLTGIEVAVCLGAMGGDCERGMKVLETVTDETRHAIRDFINGGHCDVDYLDSDIPLHFIVEETAGPDYVSVEIRYDHTNIYKIIRNGEVIFEGDEDQAAGQTADRSGLSIDNIKEFADTVDVSEVKDLLDQEIRCNMDIAYEGMAGDYGVGIGKVIKTSYPESTLTRMKAYAAAASEARMEGCDMPVIINSGSGNQGIASSVPVIVYARENYVPQEKLYRALVFSGLLTVHQKEYIGKLSAFCGAVSASCAAGAAITYLAGGTSEQIKDTVENTLANIPGIICDGAKASCAAKIATSLDASMMAHYLAMQGRSYQAFTGILKGETDQTISTVGYIGKVGMHETDREIIQTMLE